MSRPYAVAVPRTAWQIVLAALAFLQVVASFRGLDERLGAARWAASAVLVGCFFALGHWRVSLAFRREFLLLVAILCLGCLTQLPDTLDARALVVAVSYGLTALAAFLIAPCTFRRRSVQRLVWPALLFGVTIATALGEYLGYRELLASFSVAENRWRYWGAFNLPNSAGTAGLAGVILVAAAFHSARRWRYLLPLPLFAATMLLADSRGSVLAALAFLGTLATMRVARWRTERIALAACLGVVATLGYALLHASNLEWPDMSHAQMNLNLYSTGRLESWQASLSYLDGPMQWIFGLGLSKNLSFVGRWTWLPVPIFGSNADNFFVDLLGRAGLVGIALFAAIAVSLTWRLCNGVRAAPAYHASDRSLGMAVLASTLVLGLTNSVIFTWGALHAMVAWPLALGVTARAGFLEPSGRP